MFSDLVQRLARASGKALVTGLTRTGLLAFTALVMTSAQAAWQDPLNTPAIKTEKAHQALLLDVVRADRRLVAVGAHGNIVYSDDNGLSWTQAQVPVSVTLTAVYFASGEQGWAVGHDGVILHTSDGGKTWSKQFDGYRANDAMVAAAERKKQKAEDALAAAEESADEVAIEDAEYALEAATFGLDDAQYDQSTGSTKPFLDVWFYDARRGYAVGAYGMFFGTTDGGQSWDVASENVPNPDRLHINSIAAVGSHTLVLIGEMGLLIRSDDLGKSWTRMEAPYDGSLFGLVSEGDDELLFGLRGHVYRSSDSGISWAELQTGSEQTLLAGVFDSRHALLVGNGGSVVVFDGQLENPHSTIIEGRKAYAAVTRAADDTFVIVGEAGVMRLNATGELIHQSISMAAGDF